MLIRITIRSNIIAGAIFKILSRSFYAEILALQGFPAGLRDSYFIRDKSGYPEFRDNQAFSTAGRRKGFEDALRQKETIYLVAYEKDILAGYCGLLQSFDEADITNVAVVEKFRGKGVATELLEQLFLRGYERGIENFTLEVRVGNAPAIHLYEKLGFERSGIRPNFYEKPKEDALIMWKYGNH